MMCLRSTSPRFTPSTFSTFSPYKSTPLLNLKPQTLLSFSTKLFSSSPSSPSLKMTQQQTIEHIVLFKLKPNTDPTKLNSMLTGLNSLTSLDQVLHLSAGPIHKNRSFSFTFTHMLHSRYNTKQDLGDYSSHPAHMSVVKESVLPICDDIMAVDWVANLNTPVVHPSPGSAIRVNFLKLKEGLGEGEKGKVLEVIGGLKERFGLIDQISFGENFSPARAKGFSIASLAVFPGLNELEEMDLNEEVVNEEKEKVKEFLDSVVVVDYVVQPPQSASL